MADSTNNTFFNPMLHGESTGSSWADDEVDEPMHMRKFSQEIHESKEENPAECVPDQKVEEQVVESARAPPVQRPQRAVPDVPPFTAYVGNFPYNFEEEDVAFIFKDLQVTRVRIKYDRNTRKSRGYAYVEFETREDLCSALGMNGEVVSSRNLRVDVAEDKRTPDRRVNSDRQDNNQKEIPAERPRLRLLPRNKSTEGQESEDTRRKKIFGDAKPRDETIAEQRRSQELQRKSSVDSSDNSHKNTVGQVKILKNESTEGRETRSSQDEPNRKPRHGSFDGKSRARGGRGGRGRGSKDRADRVERSEKRQDRRNSDKQPRNKTARKPTNAAPPAKVDKPKVLKNVAPKLATGTRVQNAFSCLDLDSSSDESD